MVISLTVENVDGWYDHLKNSDVKILTKLRVQERAPVRSFYFEDPGGYSLEIQEFTRPEDKEIFPNRINERLLDLHLSELPSPLTKECYQGPVIIMMVKTQQATKTNPMRRQK